MDLEKDVNEYNTRYSKGYIIPIDTAIDDIETLELSEKILMITHFMTV